MVSRLLTYCQKRIRRAAEPPEPENPRHGDHEIGGRRFRVGFDDAGIPYHYRTKRRNKRIALLAVGALAFGLTGYSLGSFAQDDATPAAAVCAAADAHGRAGGGTSAIGHAIANFNLNVFNSTDRDFLAAQTAAQLRQRGFTVDLVSNDPLGSNLSVPAEVRGSKFDLTELGEVAAEVPGARIRPDSRSDPSVDLVLGTGFTGLTDLKQKGCTP